MIHKLEFVLSKFIKYIDKRKTELFIIAYILWVISNSFLTIFGNYIYYFVKISALCFFILSSINLRWKKQNNTLMIIFIIICFLIFFNNKNTDFIILPILICSAINISFYKIPFFDLPVRSVGILCTVLCYLTKIVPSNNIVSTSSFLGCRFSLGYFHPNNLFIQIFYICIDILLINRDNLKLNHYFIILLLDVVFGIITYSRTGMIILTLLTLLVFIYDKKKNINLIVKTIIHYSFIICFFISGISTLLLSFEVDVIKKIDTIISGRFTFALRCFNNYGFSLFGKYINYVSTESSKLSNENAVVLDNLYFYLIISCGLIFTILFLYLITRAQNILLSDNQNILALIIFCFALYSITEKVFFSVNNNYTLLLLSYVINYKNINKYIV